MNAWTVCDVAKKKNKIKPVLNKSWKVSTLDDSAIKGVKRKHEEAEVNKSSGKFIVSELNTNSEKSIKKRKSKTEEGKRINTLQKQQRSEDVNNVSTENYNIFTQGGGECKAESIHTVAKQSNVSNELKQNSPRKSKIKGNNEVSPKVNGLAKANGNISKSKISDWGGEWDVPLEDGDIEIIIPNKELTKKQKQQGQFTPSPGHVGPTKKATPENRINKPFEAVTPGNSGSKRVEFVLARNTSQEVKDYKRKVKNNSQIPFSAEKKPVQSVLKSTPVSSPINPFYRLSDSFNCF